MQQTKTKFITQIKELSYFEIEQKQNTVWYVHNKNEEQKTKQMKIRIVQIKELSYFEIQQIQSESV